jgi:hypothetical protein
MLTKKQKLWDFHQSFDVLFDDQAFVKDGEHHGRVGVGQVVDRHPGADVIKLFQAVSSEFL